LLISLVNSTDSISDHEVQTAIRSINRQLQEDFKTYWNIDVKLRLEGRSGEGRNAVIDPSKPLEMRGDAVLYLWGNSDDGDPLGYHDLNYRGIPYGFVFLDISAELGESWTVTLSHEALEIAIDPEANLLVRGTHPDPAENGRLVFHWYETCDACQDETYIIDDIEVSNFLLPLYFTPGEEKGRRNDFLGTINDDGSSIKSFGVNPGGYVGFFDPKIGQHQSFFGDKRAKKRDEIKNSSKGLRRSDRKRLEYCS
jgi:hypothetical protein